uniref:Peroxisomal membrane protein PEX14-like KPWE domain-containing protein n=1 Tax=Falco tinnunculus TaxID=100819 RepID=A0A8C4XQB0_FALTI
SSRSVPDVQRGQTQTPSRAAAPAPALAEVLRLVQSGQEPPGVRRPHVSPTGGSPTASRLPPPPKPWERPPHGSAHSTTATVPVPRRAGLRGTDRAQGGPGSASCVLRPKLRPPAAEPWAFLVSLKAYVLK